MHQGGVFSIRGQGRGGGGGLILGGTGLHGMRPVCGRALHCMLWVQHSRFKP